MTMKLRCPACGAESDLAQMTQAAELLALDRAAAAFGDDWPLVKEYLDAFRSPVRGALPLTKRLRLAREIWQMWQGGQCEFDGQVYQVDRPEFRAALITVVNQVKVGLTNHNYLKKVLVGAARETSQRRERELKDREKGSGARDQGSGWELPELPKGLPAEMPREWREKLEELSRAVRQPGLIPEARAAARQELEEHLEKGKDAEQN